MGSPTARRTSPRFAPGAGQMRGGTRRGRISSSRSGIRLSGRITAERESGKRGEGGRWGLGFDILPVFAVLTMLEGAEGIFYLGWDGEICAGICTRLNLRGVVFQTMCCQSRCDDGLVLCLSYKHRMMAHLESISASIIHELPAPSRTSCHNTVHMCSAMGSEPGTLITMIHGLGGFDGDMWEWGNDSSPKRASPREWNMKESRILNAVSVLSLG